MAKDLDQTRSSAAHHPLRRWRERYRDVGLSVILGLQATTMFVIAPLAATGHWRGEVIEALRFGLAATAILIVNRSRLIGVIVGLTFLASLFGAIFVQTGTAGQAAYLGNIAVTIVFDLAVFLMVARAVFDAGRITVHRIMGAVILYLYVGLIFASVYRLTVVLLHPSFTGLSSTRQANLGELLYFSLGALTTSGSGGILPLHPFVRSLANLESVIGQLYPATFVARLVTLHGSIAGRGGKAEKRGREKEPDGV